MYARIKKIINDSEPCYRPGVARMGKCMASMVGRIPGQGKKAYGFYGERNSCRTVAWQGGDKLLYLWLV